MSRNLDIGTAIPDFRLPDENGVEHSLSELQGDNALVLHLSRGELLCDLTTEPGEDAIDGLAVDRLDGTIYACGPGGLWVISRAGEKLELIALPEAPHNLTWGDDDRRSLYITALTSVYRLRRSTP